MSQIYKSSVSGTPSIPTSFTTDATDTTTTSVPAFAGTVVPQSNALRVTGVNGIQTFQTTLVAGVLEIGYLQGKVTTTTGATLTALTITPTANSAQTYQFLIVGFDSANNLCVGGQLVGTCRVSGGVATVVGIPDKIIEGDATLTGAVPPASFQMAASGANILVTVTGVVGHTIDWTVINAAGVVTAT